MAEFDYDTMVASIAQWGQDTCVKCWARMGLFQHPSHGGRYCAPCWRQYLRNTETPCSTCGKRMRHNWTDKCANCLYPNSGYEALDLMKEN